MYTYFFSISQHYIFKTQVCLYKLHFNLHLRFVHYIQSLHIGLENVKSVSLLPALSPRRGITSVVNFRDILIDS